MSVIHTINLKLSKNDLAVLEKCGKTERDIHEALQLCIAWRLKQPHLPIVPIDEVACRKLGYALIHCKFNLERTKKVIDMYYTVRNLCPEFYDDWDPLNAETQKAINTLSFLILPQLTPQLDKVIILRFLTPDSDDFNPWVCSKMFILFSEVMVRKEYAYGQRYIVDMGTLNVGHIIKLTPIYLKKFYDIVVHAYALRLNGIHFINTSPVLNTLMGILKSLLKSKIYKRIYIHDNLASLHEIIPKGLLPKEYGGSQLACHEMYSKQIRDLENMRSELMADIKYRTDESKRLQTSVDELSGSMYGTFRKLSID